MVALVARSTKEARALANLRAHSTRTILTARSHAAGPWREGRGSACGVWGGYGATSGGTTPPPMQPHHKHKQHSVPPSAAQTERARGMRGFACGLLTRFLRHIASCLQRFSYAHVKLVHVSPCSSM
eukprot:672190-Prymnesium_polylepis.1